MTNEAIGENDIVYACNYSRGVKGKCGHDFWCGKNGLCKSNNGTQSEVQPSVMVPNSSILSEPITDDGKITIAMGYDGHSFFVAKSDGTRIAFNGIDGKTSDENAPLGFTEWAWDTQLCPVVIVYSEDENKSSELTVSSRTWAGVPVEIN